VNDFVHVDWHKSSFSDTANCVEVQVSHSGVSVRNTRNRDGGTLVFTHPEWSAFIAGVQAGEFNLPQ
jgi:hypothetical protein